MAKPKKQIPSAESVAADTFQVLDIPSETAMSITEVETVVDDSSEVVTEAVETEQVYVEQTATEAEEEKAPVFDELFNNPNDLPERAIVISSAPAPTPVVIAVPTAAEELAAEQRRRRFYMGH